MLQEINYITAGEQAYNAVEMLLRSKEGQKIQEQISTADLADYLFNENGYDRFQTKIPTPSIYASIITHFSMFLVDYIDVSKMRECMAESLRAIRPEDATNEELLTENKFAIEYLFLIINRKRLISNVANFVPTGKPDNGE